MKCKGCGTELPGIGFCLREKDGDIIIDLYPEKGDDGPWCWECAEAEGQYRVDELDSFETWTWAFLPDSMRWL